MAIDLVSLALISLVSVACPIIAGLIPGKPIPETVLLLLAGALLGPVTADQAGPRDRQRREGERRQIGFRLALHA